MAADVKFDGVIFSQYEMITSKHDATNQDAKGRSSFDVTRSFFGADIKVDDHWSGRILLDAATNGAGGAAAAPAGNLVYLRNAYIKYADFMGTGIWAMIGQIGNPWNGKGTALWGHRNIITAPAANSITGVTGDSDKGLSVGGKIPMGYGDWTVAVVNGEGSQNSETVTTAGAVADAQGHIGRGKDFQALVSITPVPQHDLLKNIQVHGFVYQGTNGHGAAVSGGTYFANHRRDRWLVAASFKNKDGHLMYEYWETNTGVGTTAATNRHARTKNYSVHGSYNSPWYGLGLVGRYDHNQRAPVGGIATTQMGFAPERLMLWGITKTFNPNVRFTLAQQLKMRKDDVTSDNNADVGVGFKESKVGVYGELKF